ncbi:MAG: glycosyltransferase family 10 domain-containing protein [Ktedonobacteraceae bacterium]
MNKYSSHPRELYSARRESIRYFQSNYANQFDLFGVGWGEMARPRGGYGRRYQWHYPSYKGEVENKSEVLGCYKFALCYENMSGELGHVTEKIFDIIMSDCVPIYWGAANVESYVNHRAFIDRRNFLDNAALGAFLSGISEVAYREYIEAGKMYLSSGDFRRFLPEAFATSIIEPLGLDV